MSKEEDTKARDRALALSNIKQFFETLSPKSLEHIASIYAAEAHFKDPFHSVQGLKAIRGVFEHMFNIQPHSRFVVLGVTQSQQAADHTKEPDQYCLRWEYRLEIGGKPASIEGCSWLSLDEDGKIIAHRDYWDAAEELYEKITALAWLMRWLRRKIVSG